MWKGQLGNQQSGQETEHLPVLLKKKKKLKKIMKHFEREAQRIKEASADPLLSSVNL